MTEERQFWPSDARMAELRAQGQLPYSALTALCAASITVGALGYAAYGSLLNATEHYRQALQALSPGGLPDLSVVRHLIQLVVVPALSVAGVVLLVGVLQSRFYISAAALALDLSRIAPRLSTLNPLGAVMRALAAMVVTAVLLATGVLVGGWGIRTLLPLLAVEIERVPFWLHQVVLRVAVIVGVGLLFLGGIGVAVARMRFKMRHRMTKSEVEREVREGSS